MCVALQSTLLGAPIVSAEPWADPRATDKATLLRAIGENLIDAVQHDGDARRDGVELYEQVSSRIGSRQCARVFVVRVRWLPGDRFEVAPYGEPLDDEGGAWPWAIVVLVLCEEGSGVIVDLVAIDPRSDRSATLLGLAWACGDLYAISEAVRFHNGMLRVSVTFWDWIDGDVDASRGLLIVDWHRATREFVDRGVQPVGSDLAIAKLIAASMSAALPLPYVHVLREGSRQ